MESVSTTATSRARQADLAAASAHLKESWEHGMEAARDARRAARESLTDLSRSVEQYVETRPKTIALWALGTGLTVGFLGGVLVGRTARRTPTA